MKFTAFVLAAAAATAAAQPYFMNPGFGVGVNPSVMGYGGYQPYPVAYPVQAAAVAQPYPLAVPQPLDPLAWERDCTWINSVGFRAALSRATCGYDVCVQYGPSGNGGGHKRMEPGATAPETGYNVWGTVINRAGRVCAIAYTGNDLSQQFPYGRILSAKLANTANALSLPNRAMPSHVRHLYPDNNRGLRMVGSGNHNYLGGGLMKTGLQSTEIHKFDASFADPAVIVEDQTAAVGGFDALSETARQDGRTVPLQPLEGNNNAAFAEPTRWNLNQRFRQLFDSELDDELASDNGWWGFTLPAEQFNPGNVDVHYQGAASNYGEACGTTRQDPLCMQKPGGMVYSAGGLALYDIQGVLRGAIGVAGDNDCANHAIAWKTREQLSMDYTPKGDLNWRNFPQSSVAEVTAEPAAGQQGEVRIPFKKDATTPASILEVPGTAPFTTFVPSWRGTGAVNPGVAPVLFGHKWNGLDVGEKQSTKQRMIQTAGFCTAYTAKTATKPESINPCFFYFASGSVHRLGNDVHHNPAWNQFQDKVDSYPEHNLAIIGDKYTPAAATDKVSGWDTPTFVGEGPHQQIGLGKMKAVKWAGNKAEDNVIFSETEQMNFPRCQNIISKFATTNPTESSMFSKK